MTAWPAKPENSPAAKPRVAELLTEETILLVPAGTGKEQVIAELVAKLSLILSMDPKPLLAKVLERERGICTTLDTGLSLPHARVDGIDRIAAAMAVAPGLPSEVMFLFFSPDRKEFFPAHLQLLRAVATVLKPDLLAKLGQAASAKAALEILRAAEAAKA